MRTNSLVLLHALHTTANQFSISFSSEGIVGGKL